MRKIFPVLFLVFLLQCSFSSVSVLLPVEQVVESGGTVSLGGLQPGETLEISIEKKSGSIEWVSARIDTDLLPPGWNYSSEKRDRSILLRVQVPAEAKTATQNLGVIAFNDMLEERFNALVNVRKGLIVPEIRALKMEVNVNECAKYRLRALNESIAAHEIEIKSDLPEYWFFPRKISLAPHESLDANLEVCGKSPGYRAFAFFVDSAFNGERFLSSEQEMVVLPTLQGKYTSIGSGFPFFSVTLFPYYLVDFFLSSVSFETDFS